MNVKGRLEHIANLNNNYRAHGITTELVKAAKELHAIYLVHSHEEALRLTRLHKGLTVKSIDINLEGFAGPFIVDHHAVDILLGRAANKIETLEKLNKDQEIKLQMQMEEIGSLERKRRFLSVQFIKRGVELNELQGMVKKKDEEIEKLKSEISVLKANDGQVVS